MPSPEGDTIELHVPPGVLDRGEEVLHSPLLFTTLCARNSPPGVQPRRHQVEEPLVVRFHASRNTKSNCPGTSGDVRERVAGQHRDDVGEAGALDVGGEFLRAHRVVLDGGEPAAGVAQAQADPDRAVAARAADLQRRVARATRRSARRNRPSSAETASWPVSFAADLVEQPRDLRREAVLAHVRRGAGQTAAPRRAPSGAAKGAGAAAEQQGPRGATDAGPSGAQG